MAEEGHQVHETKQATFRHPAKKRINETQSATVTVIHVAENMLRAEQPRRETYVSREREREMPSQ